MDGVSSGAGGGRPLHVPTVMAAEAPDGRPVSQ